MSSTPSPLQRYTFCAALGASAAILFSIAVSQILLGVAFVLLLASRQKPRFPPIKLPLGLFMLGTVVSLFLSGNPALGLPQIKKFFVFLFALVVYSAFRKLSQVRLAVLVWSGIASLSAIFSFVQFFRFYEGSQEAHSGFYQFYIGSRITGFMSHWMTLGGEEMIIIMMLAALLFLGPAGRWRTAGWTALGLLIVSLALGLTRSIWIGTFLAGIYLIWFWKRWLVPIVPLLAAAMLFFAPVRERAVSIFHSHGDMDSNQFRVVVWRTGMEMIRAHPWFGVGPEEVKPQFDRYVPPDIPRPLPSGWYGHLHNIYIQYAAERGIPTMLMMMWLIAKVLYDLSRALRRGVSNQQRWIVHGVIAVIVGILVEGVAEYNLGDSEVLTLFLVCVSFGYLAIENVPSES
jgi:O-antigen ligase